MKIVIVGGVAAGASAAARLRRLDETCRIVMVERGPYISYANCGIPYHLGGVIADRDHLMVMSPEGFSARFDVDVRMESEVVAVYRERKEVEIVPRGGEPYRESYDKLVLATGSSPVVPDIPGVDHPRVKQLWTIPDLDGVLRHIDRGTNRALVMGGGFIGLEAAENLAERGIDTTLVQSRDQVLPIMDKEMTVLLLGELERLGVKVRLGRKAVVIEDRDGSLEAVLDDGEAVRAGVAIMSVGVRPNSGLAAGAGLRLGAKGHIAVDERMRTDDPDIYAAGDAIEVRDPVYGGVTAIPLAGPANKQGRIVADNIAGRPSRYFGTLGASVIKIGRLSAAAVGHTERWLAQTGRQFHKIYLNPPASAGYYPGGSPLFMKLLFDADGKILGAQAVGAKGADKRIDVIATAMRGSLTVREMADLELSYAPPFNAARDPVNMAGMVASNVLDGLTRLVYADALPGGTLFLDVREEEEIEDGALPGSVHIPLGSLRGRLGELDRGKPVVVYCQGGLRAYAAERMLRQNGFDVRNLSGGYAFYRLFQE